MASWFDDMSTIACDMVAISQRSKHCLRSCEMNVVKRSTSRSSTGSVPQDNLGKAFDHHACLTMYSKKPDNEARELFDLEAMVAKRMEMLAWIDMRVSSQKTQNLHDVLTSITQRLPVEIVQSYRSDEADRAMNNVTTLGEDAENAAYVSPRKGGWTKSERETVSLTSDEDLVSHMLCRFAFCTSEKWRKWFIRTEELLMRARLKVLLQRHGHRLIPEILVRNGLPCEALTESTAPPKLQRFIASITGQHVHAQQQTLTYRDFVRVPLGLATRLIKDRSVLCHQGYAILQYSQSQEVFLAVYKSHMARALHDAFTLRSRLNDQDEDARTTMMTMLDAFLTRFVADPQDQLREQTEGVVSIRDIPYLAASHFPLCMRRIDGHVRSEGHLKHHGRFMYGLFLKAIGLSMEDSMQLFSSLMTVTHNGSLESFSKSAYGYGIRHMYGKEGVKKSYSSLSCGKIIALPPAVEAAECHGCPFRCADERGLREQLKREVPNPYSSDLPPVKLLQSDIEDIVQDTREQHYPRACHKYFMALHPEFRKDSLFRSPYEYFVSSMESKAEYQRNQGVKEASPSVPLGRTPPTKRMLTSEELRHGVTKSRTESN